MQSLKHPARVVPLAFLIAISIGTVLLMLPISRQGFDVAPPLTALFTAVSAVCVTGLATVDTPTYWSPFGQGVIAALIQVGGFGIMTLASMLGLVVAGRLRLRNRLAAQAETKSLGLGDVRKVVFRVALITLVVETALAVALTLRFRFTYQYALDDAIWHGTFHSISAFNNAGFALYSDSLMGFVTDPLITMPIGLAVIIGGIGFPVVFELARRVRHPTSWSLHSRITLLGTGLLLAVGFIAYLAFEWQNPDTFGPLGAIDKLQAALFAAIMPRTAGFNAISIGDLSPETLVITEVLMVIGGGSAGTAGGIKITTFFLLAFVIWAEVRGEPDVSIFGRRIGQSLQRQAMTVALLGVGMVAVSTLALLSVTDFTLSEVMFESASAFGTVGLSTGITPDLPPAAQLIVILEMYAGRVGTIAVAAALALRIHKRRFKLPTDQPIVG